VKSSYISSFKPAENYRNAKKYWLAFFLAFAVSLFCLESLNRYFIVHKSKPYLTWYEFETQKREVKILLLGDSHFWRGVDAGKFKPNTFNLSIPNASYISSYYLLKQSIDDMPILKAVVIPVDLHSFSSYRLEDSTQSIFWDRFVDYHELSGVSGHPIIKNPLKLTLVHDEFGKASFINNIKESLRKIFQPEHASLNKMLNQAYLGENPKEQTGQDEKARQKVNQQLEGFRAMDPVVLAYFEKILLLCKEKNIRVITVQMPLSDHYIRHAEKFISKNNISDLLNSPDIKPYLFKNLNHMELYAGRDDYFSWAWRDGDHLNSEGKERFSELLASELSKAV